MSESYYKIISHSYWSCHGGWFNWTQYLPHRTGIGKWEPGKWTPIIPDIKICSRGYHVTSTPLAWDDSSAWSSRWYKIEIRFKNNNKAVVNGVDKVCCMSIRLLYPVVKKTKKPYK